MNRTTHAASLLRTAGLRATEQRIQVLAHLMTSGKPESVETIRARLRAAPDLSTLYRSLEQMRDVGLVRTIALGQESLHYEFNGAHHHHLVCRSCGRVEDVAACAEPLSSRTLARSGFKRVDYHALEFFGWCAACA